MSKGFMVFPGVRPGFQAGDLVVSLEETGQGGLRATMSSSFDLFPVWIRLAREARNRTRDSYEQLRNTWDIDPNQNYKLLLDEFVPAMECIVASAFAIEAIFSQIMPFAKIPKQTLDSWNNNRTSRADRICEVISRVGKLSNQNKITAKAFLTELFKLRDAAVHPSSKMVRTVHRLDLDYDVDANFGKYTSSAAIAHFQDTLSLILLLLKRKDPDPDLKAFLINMHRSLLALGTKISNADGTDFAI
jgi:hypothetical protein